MKTLRVRVYECDSFGHVNNAVYIQYLQQATFDLVKSSLSTCKLGIEYYAPARNADELQIDTWIAGVENGHVALGCEITRQPDHSLLARAQVEGTNSSLGGYALEAMKQRPLLRPFAPASDNGAKPFRWRHKVRRYELGSEDKVSLAAYFNWLEEATFDYCERAGWGIDRLRKENFLVLQRRHDAAFYEPLGRGEEIEIVSRLIEVRSVRGTWIHELRRVRDSALIMRDYSTGAFLDWQGKIRPALEPMMDALAHGDHGGLP